MSADTNTSTTLFNYNSSSSASSPPPPPPPPHPAIVASPCAACKILRRRCVDKCVLAPYFPPTEPLKFTTAHRVFGASNIIKFLQVSSLARNLTFLLSSTGMADLLLTTTCLFYSVMGVFKSQFWPTLNMVRQKLTFEPVHSRP